MKIAQIILPALFLLVLLTFAYADASKEYAVGPVIRQDDVPDGPDGEDTDDAGDMGNDGMDGADGDMTDGGDVDDGDADEDDGDVDGVVPVPVDEDVGDADEDDGDADEDDGDVDGVAPIPVDGDDGDADEDDGDGNGVVPVPVAPVTPDVVAPVTPDVVAPVTPNAVVPDAPDVVAPVTPDVVAPVAPDVVAPVPSPAPPAAEPAAGSCAAAEAACLLGFAGADGLQTFSVPQPADQPFTPSIISKDPSVQIGIVNSNIEGEFITADGNAVLFSQLSLPGVQPFSPNFFKPVAMMDGRTSGIAHESLQAGQAAVAPGNCVRVFITEWQVLSPSGQVIDNINGVTDRSQNVCVVFQTSA